jgi:hypothetical protein
LSFRQKNQHFGTLDLIMLVVLCGTVSSVVGASVAGLLHDDRPTRARTTAESMAYQIRQQHDAALASLQGTSQPGRSPASVSDAAVPPLTDGQMGKDPWGHPYFYTVLGKPTDPNSTIVVWSEGPDGKLESKIDELNEQNVGHFHFRGDDVGFISNGHFAVRDVRRSR